MKFLTFIKRYISGKYKHNWAEKEFSLIYYPYKYKCKKCEKVSSSKIFAFENHAWFVGRFSFDFKSIICDLSDDEYIIKSILE